MPFRLWFLASEIVSFAIQIVLFAIEIFHFAIEIVLFDIEIVYRVVHPIKQYSKVGFCV